MEKEAIINGFAQLGKLMVELGNNKKWSNFSLGVTSEEYESLETLIVRQKSYNGWFTPEFVRQSLLALGEQLKEKELIEWSDSYNYASQPHAIGIIMAGNIPLVGFHDFLCVLISGNRAVCKLSSNDKTLLPAIAKHLIEFAPVLKDRIVFTEGRIGDIEAVIATGSNNSLNYFEQYFGKYPHIFRNNRTSVAVIRGDESAEELNDLGSDIFNYFGLGCRNVSHILFPANFDLNRFFKGIFSHSDVINNNKYGNNYDYNKAVYLMNQLPLLDNNFVLLRETEELFSPLAMIHYHYYQSKDELKDYISKHQNDIQVVVGKGYLDFGHSQKPGLSDYADGVDVMNWLESLEH